MSTEELESCIISGMVTFGYNCIFRTQDAQVDNTL